ncbi:MAG: hypothetical protein NXI10_05435 [bacterium]|nr:hypothetical protein [bacterium]
MIINIKKMGSLFEKQKINYHKLTFLLSVIGFIGSIGFYIGVLRQVYSSDQNTDQAHQIELLQQENENLQQKVQELNKELEKK